jgi:hypothetical protein
MSEATEIAERIASALPDLKRGTLRMFGDWFGRPWDNLHTIVAAEAEENCLILHFDEGETLRVWEPGGDEADASLFRIWRATPAAAPLLHRVRARGLGDQRGE